MLSPNDFDDIAGRQPIAHRFTARPLDS